MQLSELLVLLQYEVQKSYDFVHAITRAEVNKDTSVLHISLERVEIDLPVSLEEREASYNPKQFKSLPEAVKRLNVPYSPESAARKIPIPHKEVKGKSIHMNIVGPTEKIDETVTKEKIGRIKVVLKPVIK